MTTQRVREIFKDQVETLTDEEIVSFIANTSVVCDELLKISIGSLTKKEAYDHNGGRI